MRVYLGAPEPVWLERPASRAWIVSARRLRRYKRDYRPVATWALDSGAFMELRTHGRWKVGADTYAAEVRRWAAWGGLEWCGQQDWMCEPEMIERTGRSVRYHQDATIANLLELRALGCSIAIPSLQGWTLDEYRAHVAGWERAGIDLAAEPRVGIGSVCRRKRPADLAPLLRDLWRAGVTLHGYGMKSTGLRQVGAYLASVDSMAWSYGARRRGGDRNGAPTAERWAARLPAVQDELVLL